MFRDLTDEQLAQIKQQLSVTITKENSVAIAAMLFIMASAFEVADEIERRTKLGKLGG